MSRPYRILMLGTGDFAVPTFRALIDSPHQTLGLYSQRERIGQGHHQSTVHRIKQLALDRHVPVFQPQSINTPEVLAELRAHDADLFVVAAYGQILCPELLTIPKVRAINVHASLLPKYRGASPIVYSIWKGDMETGVSIIEVLPALDAGQILATAKTPILPEDTAGTLEDRLSELGPPLVLRVLDELASGTTHGIPQDPALVTRAPKLKKSAGWIDWAQTGFQIDRQVRAMQPWPMPATDLLRPNKPPQRLLILQIRELPAEEIASRGLAAGVTPGQIRPGRKAELLVASGNGAVEIVRLQPTGKRPMLAAEFLRGTPVGVECLLRPPQG